MKSSFKINRITWHEVSTLVNVDPIHEVLNTYIDLSKYGEGIAMIDFTFVAVKPNNTRHGNDAKYNPKDKTLTLQLNLSYPHLKLADKQEALSMMATLFYISIDLYEGLHIPDFDTKAFKTDIDHLFESKGWLSGVRNR